MKSQVYKKEDAEKSTLINIDKPPSSVKTQSIRLRCHVDGPLDESTFPSPPLSPLRKVSDVLKSVEIPEEMNFVVAPAVSIEAAEFWEMVETYVHHNYHLLSLQFFFLNRLCEKSNSISQQRPKYLTAPMLSQQLDKPASNRHSSVSIKTVDLLTVVVEIGQGSSPVTFQCPCKL